jgi:ABC-type proline/glycine betaine transport system ATPase subunit
MTMAGRLQEFTVNGLVFIAHDQDQAQTMHGELMQHGTPSQIAIWPRASATPAPNKAADDMPVASASEIYARRNAVFQAAGMRSSAPSAAAAPVDREWTTSEIYEHRNAIFQDAGMRGDR